MTKAAAKPQWEGRIAAWRASGLSSEKFARSQGFSPQSLRNWDKRLREGDSAPRFLQLVKRAPVPAEAAAKAPSTTPSRSKLTPHGLVIEVGSARIHVDATVDEALLRRVVRALGSER